MGCQPFGEIIPKPDGNLKPTFSYFALIYLINQQLCFRVTKSIGNKDQPI